MSFKEQLREGFFDSCPDCPKRSGTGNLVAVVLSRVGMSFVSCDNGPGEEHMDISDQSLVSDQECGREGEVIRRAHSRPNIVPGTGTL